jgi:hypothetical protein
MRAEMISSHLHAACKLHLPVKRKNLSGRAVHGKLAVTGIGRFPRTVCFYALSNQ